jgi:hypothetical protein
MALNGRATRGDECPLLGAKRTLTNRCLPISIYEYTAFHFQPLDDDLWEKSIAFASDTEALSRSGAHCTALLGGST